MVKLLLSRALIKQVSWPPLLTYTPPLHPHEFHETCHSVTFYFMKKKDSERCFDTTTPESIHTKDESKRGSAFAFIFGVN